MPIRGRGIDLDTNDLVFIAGTSDVSITATTSGTANTCLTTGPFTVENPGNFYVTVYAPYLTVGTTNLDVELWDGATLVSSLSGHMAASIARPGTMFGIRTSLASGSHTLAVKAFVDGGTGHFGGGAGSTGVAPNSYMHVQPA